MSRFTFKDATSRDFLGQDDKIYCEGLSGIITRDNNEWVIKTEDGIYKTFSSFIASTGVLKEPIQVPDLISKIFFSTSDCDEKISYAVMLDLYHDAFDDEEKE